MNLDLSIPLELIGRSAEFNYIVEVLVKGSDLLIAGVPGSGRRTLVREAARQAGALILEVDCIRATNGERFLQLLAKTISQNFEYTQIQSWVMQNAAEYFILSLEENEYELKLSPSLNKKQLWQAFEILLKFPQSLIEDLAQRVVLLLQSFPHIRSWDRNGLWETTLRQEIQAQTHVNYVLVTTIAEMNHPSWEPEYPMETLQLTPLERDVLAVWVTETLQTQGLTFDAHSPALQLFLDAVGGHIGDAMALVRRLQTLCYTNGLITQQEVEQAIGELLKDLAITFESLLMLLPANQIHLLECLAYDPTDKPQSREYIQKHGLSRGGSLQGALIGLQHKGLIYGAEQGYRLALPLLALWLRQRINSD